MVQRKVSNYKLSIQGDTFNTLKSHNKQATNHTKPSSLQNNHHDINNSKGADFNKALKMKKSRSIKRSDVEISRRTPLKINDSPRHPGKPPPLFKPSTKKPSSCVPNYMKSTSSFEARKEVTTKVFSSISSTSKLQKVGKILTKTPGLKKVRSLKKAPSLKLKQPERTTIKTCSSTQKDATFPPRLELNPGATEAKGKSVLRVCKFNHCSLNDHHPKAVPPLKRFMSSRRKLLKTEKTQIPVLYPRKKNSSECKGRRVGNQDEDFLVEIYVPDRGVDQQVSESLSDGPRSEMDLHDDGHQTEDAKLSVLKFTPEIEVSPPTPVKSDLLCVSLDESICGNSELEWEEGHILTINEIHGCDEIDILNDNSNDQRKPDFDMENGIGEYLDKCHEYPPYFYDEIVEYLCLSDAGSSPDSKSTQTVAGEDEDYCTLEDEATVHATKLEDESIDKQRGIWSNLIKEITASSYDELVSCQDPVKTDSNVSNEDNCVIEETREEALADIPQITENLETSICIANNNDRGSINQNEEENHSSEDKLESNDNKVVEVNQSSRVGEFNSGGSDSNQELLDSYNKLRKGVRCKKEHEDAEKEREFNPRGPNFLELEPEPDGEKVDLRHQEMDDRRNAEEWMLDHALQKTVNQLTPARKKKVALLVEAYEAVLPVPKCELDTRRDSSVL